MIRRLRSELNVQTETADLKISHVFVSANADEYLAQIWGWGKAINRANAGYCPCRSGHARDPQHNHSYPDAAREALLNDDRASVNVANALASTGAGSHDGTNQIEAQPIYDPQHIPYRTS